MAEWRAARRELERLRHDEREIERRVELLRFQVDEIEAARLQPGELDDLEVERRRLANAERLRRAFRRRPRRARRRRRRRRRARWICWRARSAASPNCCGSTTLARRPRHAGAGVAYLAQDAADAVRSYADEIAADPARQAEVEERWLCCSRSCAANTARPSKRSSPTPRSPPARAGDPDPPRRAHGRASGARRRAEGPHRRARRRNSPSGARRGERAPLRRDGARARRPQHAPRPLPGRHHPAPDPERRPATQATASDWTRAETFAFTATGIDHVEFLIAPNPGEPFKPLVRIASGGETSRLMLALKTILANADIVPILIFDEIDAASAGAAAKSSARSSGSSGNRTRCSASPTCRRSPPWATATSASPRSPTRPHAHPGEDALSEHERAED